MHFRLLMTTIHEIFCLHPIPAPVSVCPHNTLMGVPDPRPSLSRLTVTRCNAGNLARSQAPPLTRPGDKLIHYISPDISGPDNSAECNIICKQANMEFKHEF